MLECDSLDQLIILEIAWKQNENHIQPSPSISMKILKYWFIHWENPRWYGKLHIIGGETCEWLV